MYVNKCSKCGAEFETKNPKRVICPACLYPDRNPLLDQNSDNSENQEEKPKNENPENQNEDNKGTIRSNMEYSNFRQDGGYNREGGYNRGGGFNRNNGGGFNREGGYNRGGGFNRNNGGGYNREGGYNRGGGFNRNNSGGYNRGGGFNRNNNGGGFNRRPQGGGFRRPQGGNRRPAKKALLISKEQVAMIEVLYKRMLPLPNPDAHEVIGAEINLEPNKVFFGINLVRQKLHLPKLPYPKRKLAITPDQLQAIKSLYEPLLPLPPIGCHKIIATQLKMDEWRVHVGIGLVRKQLGLDRWNQEREDAPEQYKIKPEDKKDETKSE